MTAERKPLAALILAKARDDKEPTDPDDGTETDDGVSEMGLQNASADLIAAVKGGDPKAVSLALRQAVRMVMDSE
jgi:hypothetical protein